VDDELLSIARTSIGAEVGLNPAQSRRLVGETAGEIRSDAKAMARELGLVVDVDPPRDPGWAVREERRHLRQGLAERRCERSHPAGGRAHDVTERVDMNALIRERAGRGAQLSRVLHALAPAEPPVGRSSVGFGGAGLPTYKRANDAANEAIRGAAQLAHALTVPGGVDISDLLNA
jgi:hypothetical protein